MPNNENVDERVVEMRIDNRQFVSGAEKTISILDRLKDALNFKNTKTGFDDIQKSADRVDLGGMAKDIEAIADRFSSMGIVGMSVLKNLTDSVTNFVTSTVKGLTLDPITTGFSKYEEVARSTATILAATRNELEQFGSWGTDVQFESQLEYVKNGLRTLTWYADETSASMTDMVANIGKFTNAGVKFENAVVEMMGVTNWGYQAGAGKAEQARAMYNLSQALATGSVRLMDWRSIENANMATIEFKDTVLETAVEMGALKKAADGTFKTLDGMTVSATNFSETLSKGWFTSGVLEQTLIKYGEYSRRLNSVLTDSGMQQFGITAYDVMEAMEKLSDASQDYSIQDWHDDLAETMGDEVPTIESLTYAYELLSDAEVDLSRRAFLAGQEYRTFADVLDAVKDAVSSGWMRTFELIIGDTEEAKQVWTALGDELNQIFASSAATRNAILSLWRDPNQAKGLSSGSTLISGRESLLNAIAQLYRGVRTYIDPIVNAFRQVFKLGDSTKDIAKKLLDLTYRFEAWTSKVALSEDAIAGINVVFSKLFDIIKRALGVFKPLSKIVGTAISSVKGFVEILFESFSSGSFDKERFASGVSNLLAELTPRFLDASDAVGKFADRFFNLKDKVGSVVGTIISFVSGAFDFLRDKISIAVSYIKGLANNLKTILDGFKDRIKESFSGEGIGASNILKILGGLLVFFKGKSLIGGVKDFVSSFTPIKNVLNGFSDFLDSAGEALENFGKRSSTDDLKKIAISIGILTAALVILSTVDSNKLGKSLLVIAGGLTELIGAMAGLKFVSGKKSGNATKGLIKLAASILILSLAFKVLDSLSPESMLNSLGVIFGILALIVLFLEAINLLKIKPKIITGLVSLAVSMLIFTGVIFLLGKIPYDSLVQGLTSLAIALLIISVAMIAVSKFAGAKALAAGAGMVLLATSLVVLAGAIALFSLLNPGKVALALIEMGAALVIIALAVKLMPSKLPIIAAGMLLMAAAIGVLTVVLAALTLLDPDKLFNSILVIASAMGIMVAASVLMQGCLVGALAMLAASVALVVAAAGLIVFAIALRMLVDLPFADLAKGMLLVAAGLAGLAVGLILMTAGIVGAVALIAAAGGLIVLSFALNMLTGIDLPSIAGGLSLLGLAFIPLAAGGILMIAGSVGLTAAAVAIGLMGIALIPFVYALKQFSEIPFTTYVEYLLLLGGTAGVLALLTPVLGPLAIALAAFGVACLAAGEGINLAGNGMVKISNSITAIPDNTASALKEVVKSIKETVLDVKPAGEDLVRSITDIGDDVVSAIAINGNKASGSIDSVLSKNIGLFDAYYNNYETSAYNIAIGIANGIYKGSSVVIEAMERLAEAMIIKFRNEFDIHSPSRLMEKITAYIPIGAANGINENTSVAVDASQNMAIKMVDAVRNALATVQTLADQDFDLHPTISPVVDMSNVDSAANSVNGMFSSSANNRMAAVGRNMSNIDAVARDMRALSESRANVSQDRYEINIYSQPGMDEELLADAVLYRLSNVVVRKGAALG